MTFLKFNSSLNDEQLGLRLVPLCLPGIAGVLADDELVDSLSFIGLNLASVLLLILFSSLGLFLLALFRFSFEDFFSFDLLIRLPFSLSSLVFFDLLPVVVGLEVAINFFTVLLLLLVELITLEGVDDEETVDVQSKEQ